MDGMGMNVTLDLIRQARSQPSAKALAWAGGSVAYRDLDRLVWRGAALLSGRGVRRGDAVALTFRDPVLLAVMMLSAARMGVTFVPIPGSATVHQRRLWGSAAGCSALVSDAPQLYDAGLPALTVSAADLSAARKVVPTLLDEAPVAPLMINIGSGSTGAPKLIPVTHGNMRHRSRISAASPIFQEDDRTLWLAGLEFTAVQNRMFNQLHVGKTLVLMPSASAGGIDLPSFIRKQSVTVMVASVFHLEMLLERVDAVTARTFGGLRAIRTGGSNVTDNLRARVRERLNPNLYVKYATNESGIISVCMPDGHAEAHGSIGRPLSGVDLEVTAAAGAVGPVRVRNPGVVSRYLGNDASNSNRFVDGWFHPGDLASRLPSGCFVYYGRSDHMMIVNGINLYPAEIETCLAGHPSVADVAALPLRHPVHQHVPICAVALREGANVASGELEAYARERLGARSPQRVFLLPRIPRNTQGKLIRDELGARISELL